MYCIVRCGKLVSGTVTLPWQPMVTLTALLAHASPPPHIRPQAPGVDVGVGAGTGEGVLDVAEDTPKFKHNCYEPRHFPHGTV
jgi:hypothetical protein